MPTPVKSPHANDHDAKELFEYLNRVVRSAGDPTHLFDILTQLGDGVDDPTWEALWLSYRSRADEHVLCTCMCAPAQRNWLINHPETASRWLGDDPERYENLMVPCRLADALQAMCSGRLGHNHLVTVVTRAPEYMKATLKRGAIFLRRMPTGAEPESIMVPYDDAWFPSNAISKNSARQRSRWTAPVNWTNKQHPSNKLVGGETWTDRKYAGYFTDVWLKDSRTKLDVWRTARASEKKNAVKALRSVYTMIRMIFFVRTIKQNFKANENQVIVKGGKALRDTHVVFYVQCKEGTYYESITFVRVMDIPKQALIKCKDVLQEHSMLERSQIEVVLTFNDSLPFKSKSKQILKTVDVTYCKIRVRSRTDWTSVQTLNVPTSSGGYRAFKTFEQDPSGRLLEHKTFKDMVAYAITYSEKGSKSEDASTKFEANLDALFDVFSVNKPQPTDKLGFRGSPRVDLKRKVRETTRRCLTSGDTYTDTGVERYENANEWFKRTSKWKPPDIASKFSFVVKQLKRCEWWDRRLGIKFESIPEFQTYLHGLFLDRRENIIRLPPFIYGDLDQAIDLDTAFNYLTPPSLTSSSGPLGDEFDALLQSIGRDSESESDPESDPLNLDLLQDTSSDDVGELLRSFVGASESDPEADDADAAAAAAEATSSDDDGGLLRSFGGASASDPDAAEAAAERHWASPRRPVTLECDANMRLERTMEKVSAARAAWRLAGNAWSDAADRVRTDKDAGAPSLLSQFKKLIEEKRKILKQKTQALAKKKRANILKPTPAANKRIQGMENAKAKAKAELDKVIGWRTHLNDTLNLRRAEEAAKAQLKAAAAAVKVAKANLEAATERIMVRY